MLTIEANIKYEKYNSTDELLKDFLVSEETCEQMTVAF